MRCVVRYAVFHRACFEDHQIGAGLCKAEARVKRHPLWGHILVSLVLPPFLVYFSFHWHRTLSFSNSFVPYFWSLLGFFALFAQFHTTLSTTSRLVQFFIPRPYFSTMDQKVLFDGDGTLFTLNCNEILNKDVMKLSQSSFELEGLSPFAFTDSFLHSRSSVCLPKPDFMKSKPWFFFLFCLVHQHCFWFLQSPGTMHIYQTWTSRHFWLSLNIRVIFVTFWNRLTFSLVWYYWRFGILFCQGTNNIHNRLLYTRRDNL